LASLLGTLALLPQGARRPGMTTDVLPARRAGAKLHHSNTPTVRKER
jgi:hypothetical protein